MQVFSTQRRPNQEHQSHYRASLTRCLCVEYVNEFQTTLVDAVQRCDQEFVSVNISGHRGGLVWPSSGLLQTSCVHDEISNHLCYAVRTQCKH